jgi:hypothetical protein
MELRRPDGFEWSLEQKFKKIADAGYRGICLDIGYHDFDFLKSVVPLVRDYDLDCIFNAFVKNEQDYIDCVDFLGELPITTRFVSIIGQIQPWCVDEVAAVTGNWLDIGKRAGIKTLVEIHRNCMTNDLHFTLQLMDKIPELMMVADLSHPLLNQEWYLPLPEHASQLMTRFLKRSESFQGRIGTREQIQVPIGYPQHHDWFMLFQSWWREGFTYWKQRHEQSEKVNCVFLCELGPPPYAITGPDGYELSDRWQEALILKSTAESIWKQLTP